MANEHKLASIKKKRKNVFINAVMTESLEVSNLKNLNIFVRHKLNLENKMSQLKYFCNVVVVIVRT